MTPVRRIAVAALTATLLAVGFTATLTGAAQADTSWGGNPISRDYP